MPEYGDLGSTFSKRNVRFEISTLEIGYRQNFDKITKLILFGPKYPNMGICLKFSKTNVTFEDSIFEIRVQAKFH